MRRSTFATSDWQAGCAKHVDESLEELTANGNTLLSKSSEENVAVVVIGEGDSTSNEVDDDDGNDSGGMATERPAPTTAGTATSSDSDGENDDNGDDDENDGGVKPSKGTTPGPLPPPGPSYCLVTPRQNGVKCRGCKAVDIPTLPSLPTTSCLNKKTRNCFRGQSSLIDKELIPPKTEEIPTLPPPRLSLAEQITLAVGIVGVTSITSGVILWAFRSLSPRRAAQEARRDLERLAMAGEEVSEKLFRVLVRADRRSASTTTITTSV
ncbi:uncharacterized protein LOC110985644 isoform X2 [Acanthaster planci]|uniref:Uncharacterized protein LOC110985644 isoform X2 n=1 Tax=Acanthaster planci TaxID=133434 RepID=A0A8B7ZA26_ACAPL|nr:uncharacterized protein LOC110985644 isoform X2 [Acanthaster planci]